MLALSAVGGLFAGVVLGGMARSSGPSRGCSSSFPRCWRPAATSTARSALARDGASPGAHQPAVHGDDDRINAAVAAALANGVLISGVAAVMAVALLALVGRPSAPLTTLVAIALIAGLSPGCADRRRRLGRVRRLPPWAQSGHLAGPVVTTTGDVVGIATLLGATRLVLALGGG